MFNRSAKQLCKLAMIAIALPCQINSAMAVEASGKFLNSLIISSDKGSQLQLAVRDAPLAAVLNNISQKTHIPIHYSVLPEGLVSATCAGPTLKPILECLLARKTDLVFRNSPNPGQANDIAEVWIMGSSLASSQARSEGCSAVTKNAKNELQASGQTLEKQENESDRTDELLTMSESKDPDERAAAIGALQNDGRKDDPTVKATLEKALSDHSPTVRAQAVSTLTQLEGDYATPILQDALHDESADVRLMAVSAITDDVTLLRQAIHDSDETVRVLAATKLEELTKSDGNH